MARRSASWAAGSSPACTSSTTGRTQPPEAAERVADQLRMGRLLELERTTELPLAIFRHGLVQSPEVAPRLRLAAGKRIANGGQGDQVVVRIRLAYRHRQRFDCFVVAAVQRQAEAAHADHRETHRVVRSEEHTSELPSLMRISYAVFCL